MSHLREWLAFNDLYTSGHLTTAKVRALLDYFQEPVAIFKAAGERLKALGLRTKQIELIQQYQWSRIEDDLIWQKESDQHCIIIGSAAYPKLLLEIPDPPLVLYVKGDPDLLQFPQLGMIGSRHPTHSGIETAQSFARHLAECGFVITSGLATGIDAASHQGALVSGKTVAVIGTGVNHIYPKSNAALYQKIVSEGGAIVSEYRLDEPPKRENFPRRNRLISGLSVGILVVEATLRSGSLITARCAAEQGRELFAIPGSIHNPLARGCHRLIRDGAKLVETAGDIFEELKGILENPFSNRHSALPIENSPAQEKKLDADYEKLLSSIGFEPTSIDLICERTGFSAEMASSMLLILELDGVIHSTPGGYSK